MWKAKLRRLWKSVGDYSVARSSVEAEEGTGDDWEMLKMVGDDLVESPVPYLSKSH